MKEKIIALIQTVLDELKLDSIDIKLEIPKNKENGDYSSTIALQLAKIMKQNPMDIAQKIAKMIDSSLIEKIDVASPGFINFYLKKDYLLDNIMQVILANDKYGSCKIGNNRKINIEFVSANPTGILHMGNARGGAYGDSLARIMSFCGYDVTKEYYLNDAGNQINKLGNSIRSRYLTLCGIENEFPENGYPGNEIYDIAKLLYEEHGNTLTEENLDIFKSSGVEYLTKMIMADLAKFRIEYDVVTSEKSIYQKYPMEQMLNLLDKNGYLYQKDGATWFKSSQLLDDTDHVLVKNDGNYTYLLPDISYHMDKLNRGYDKIIDVLGTDHHGYVSRLKSAIKAIDHDESKLEVKLLQLVRITKNNETVAMHKRSGNIITLNDLLNEVGVNAARYYFSKYSLDTQMDFDIDLAKSKSNDNPVYYVSYAYARICSILNKYPKIENIEKYETIHEDVAYNVLANIYKFPDVVKNACAKEMPHLVTNYIYELATSFHTFYEKCRIITDDERQTLENLNIIKAVQITLKNALYLIGIVPEERM